MALVDPDGIIEFLREQQERDLALIALVAGMRDSEAEAIERLNQQAALARTMSYGPGVKTKEARLRRETWARVATMAERLANLIAQVEEAGKKRAA